MVLCHLLESLKLPYGVAHVNHNTRDGDSDKDEQFVRAQFANKEVHVKNLKVSESGNFHDLTHRARYAFFRELGYDLILTAHHKDDDTETKLINIINGRSVSGISNHDQLLRPLLIFDKSEIQAYAEEHIVSYVHDKSNDDDYYLRNLLRNKLIPEVNKKVDLSSNLNSLSTRINSERKLLVDLIKERYSIEKGDGDGFKVTRSILEQDNPHLLKIALREFGLNLTQAENLLAARQNIGALVHTPTHDIVIDRENLIIRERGISDGEMTIDLDSLPIEVSYNSHTIRITEEGIPSEYSQECHYLSKAKLNQSVYLRSWKEGDKFEPLGMGGSTQTLKKFFANNKIDRLRKATLPLLCNDQDILMIVGMRSSEKYKIEPEDKSCIKVELI